MRLSRRFTDRQLMMVLSVVIGVLAALVAWVFETLLHWIREGLVGWFSPDGASVMYLVYPVVGIILATLWVKYVVKDNISEGVTRVLYAIAKQGSRIKSHNMWSSVVGGAVTIGFGGSVGPEAPIVLTGSAIGSRVGQFMRMNYRQVTMLLGCGAAAALAAVFKAPVTGVIFVLEILMLDISMAAVIPLVLSSLTATTLIFFLKGFDPVLEVMAVEGFRLSNLPMYLMLGVSCGVVSFYFTSVNGRIARWFEGMGTLARKWIAGGIVLGVLIFVFPPLYGEGYAGFADLMHGRIEELFNNSLFYEWRSVPWVVGVYLLGILFFKVVAMAATNAAGGVGGTFAPSMFVGAFTGGSVAFLANTYLGMNLPLLNFTLVGMAGVMAGVMKAPLTSIFLVAELSNGYALFVPLMVVTIVAYVIGHYFEPASIYTKKLLKTGDIVTHDKDSAVMVFLDLEELTETDFSELHVGTTLGDAVKVVARAKRNTFPVVDDGGALEGVVQLDDLRGDMFSAEKYGTPIEEYLTAAPDVIHVHEQVSSVLAKFEQTGAWVLPVVDREERYTGFVSKSRILAAYRKQLLEISD